MSDLLEVPSIVSGISSLLDTVIKRIWPDPSDQAKAIQQLAELRQSGELAFLASQTELAKAQIATNTAEATSNSWIASNWRPLLGLSCVGAFAVQFILGPWLTWLAALAGHPTVFPQLNTGDFMPVLIGMLGLGGLRTFEKYKGVN